MPTETGLDTTAMLTPAFGSVSMGGGQSAAKAVTGVIGLRPTLVYSDKGTSMLDTLHHAVVFGPSRPSRRAAGSFALESPVGTRAAISELDDIDVLVRTYRARILRFVTFSTGDPDLAETITQDCLLKAYNARASFRGDSSVNTWLTSIAVNLIRDHQRTRKFKFWRQAKASAVDVSDVASFIASDETTQEAQLIAKQQVARLATIIEDLSFNQKTVFLMKFSDEMELQQIAEAMNMPINTVKTHLHRALKSVRAQLVSSQTGARV